jgi:hypothetical protein
MRRRPETDGTASPDNAVVLPFDRTRTVGSRMVSWLVEHVDTSSDPEPAETTARWATVLGIALPDGAMLHPTVFDQLHRRFADRSVVVERGIDTVCLVCSLSGDTATAASADATSVEAEVLNVLGLPSSAIVERQLAEPRTVDDLIDEVGWGPSVQPAVALKPRAARPREG